MKFWVLTKPRTKQERVEQIDAQTLRVWIQAPPVDGKANEALLRALATYFSVPVSSVKILRGTTGKRKLVEIKT